MKFFLIIILSIITNITDNAQTITTVVGCGSCTGLGDLGAATLANVSCPTLAIEKKTGNYYIADGGHNRIRKVTKITGIITTYAGNGTAGFMGDGGAATIAELNGASWIAIDTIGNLYITDGGNNRIRKVDTFGNISTFAGNGTIVFSGDGGPATDASLNAPQGVCTDNFGNVFIVDGAFPRVRKVDISGTISTYAGNGISGFSGDGGPATNAEFVGIYGICSDILGNIYIADWNGNRIRKVAVGTGIITTIAGNGIGGYTVDGILATSSELFGPFNVGIDDTGNLYIDDWENERIRKVNSSGIIQTVAGNGIAGYTGDGGFATSFEINRPEGIAFDACSNMYIADFNNRRIRKVTYPGSIFTPSVTISVVPNDTLCLGIPASFTATSTGGGTLPSYQWYINGIDVGVSSSSYIYTPSNGDIISCVLTSNSPCASIASANSNLITMVIDSILTPAISLYGTVSATVGSIVTITATVSNAGSSYLIHWMNHGLEFTTTSLPSVTYSKLPGIDTITARIVSTSSGCYDSTISSRHIVDGGNTGLKNILIQDEITLFPNPADQTLTINSLKKISHITISNLLGQSEYSQAFDEEKVEINIGNLPPGMYLLELIEEDGEKVVRKVLKE